MNTNVLTTPVVAECDMDAERSAILMCQKGSKDAFGTIVKRYMRRAYLAAVAIVGNRDDAMDISQEAFVKAYRAIGRFDPDRPFYPWFLRILRNQCFDWLRKRRARPAGDLVAELPDNRMNPEVLARRDEIRDEVWSAVRKLSERDREIIVLRHFQHLTYAEIAETLGIPQGTVMSRLFTARSRLREHLKERLASED
ncbi:MAG: sigma-70 family RNA polymerase sigma factor [Planctomycetota bacterium]